LKVANEFIIQSITTNNKIVSKPFLLRPENRVLKQIYIIRLINLNLRSGKQIDKMKLIDSLLIKKSPL
jgi:hypothetical protein